MLDVFSEDFIRTARAKGLSWRKVTYRHALRNAAIPLVTILGLDFGRLLGGAVIVETVFAWPGMGRYMVDAIMTRDVFVVQEPSQAGVAISMATVGRSAGTWSRVAWIPSIWPASAAPSKVTSTLVTPAAASASNSAALLTGSASAARRARAALWASICAQAAAGSYAG